MEFTLSTTINASAIDLFDGWLTSKVHAEMTGGSAEISKEVNRPFKAWDEYISGKNLEIKPNYIKQTWRTSDFEKDQEDSIIEIYFEENKAGKTKITLHHTNLLDKDLHYKRGWMEHYFEPMKEYFEKK